MGIRITGTPFSPRAKATSRDVSSSQDHPSAQAGGSPGIAAVLPAVGGPALLQQSSATASPGGTSWREPIYSANWRTDSLLLPFPRGCSARPLVRSRPWWHPSALSPARTSLHPETIPSAGSGSSWPVPPPAFAEPPPAALSHLPSPRLHFHSLSPGA